MATRAWTWCLPLACVCLAIALLAAACWWALPRLAPEAVLRWSPWPDPAVRAVMTIGEEQALWQRLEVWGGEATPALLRSLRDPANARLVLALLPHTNDPTALPALEAYAGTLPVGGERDAVHEVIAVMAGRLHDEAALIWLLRDAGWRSGGDLRYGGRFVASTYDHQPAGVTRVAIDLLASASVDDRVRAALALSGAHGGEAGDALLRACDDPEAAVRRAASIGLLLSGAAGPDRLVPLVDACGDETKRERLVVALNKHRSAPAVRESLQRWMHGDPSPIVRAAAVRLVKLAVRDDPADALAAAALADAVDDRDARVRKAAADAFAAITAIDDRGALVRHMGDEDETVRVAGAAALAARGDTRAIEPLLTLAAAKDPEVANQAREALWTLPLDDAQRARARELSGLGR